MLSALLGSCGAPAAPRPTSRLPNVVVITLDTVRADHLHVYGDARIETPRLDALARSGTRFSQAYTPVPITLPAHTAIFTGSFPMATGMHDFSGNQLAESIPTLASVLRASGYATAAFIAAAVLDARFGLNQGFDTYDGHFDFSRLDETNLDLMARRGDDVMARALAWLGHGPPQPFLLWVHLYDAHYPYTSAPPYTARYRGRPYDAAIAFDDAQVGRLIGFLQARGLYDPALIVLCADHGEGLGEHGEKTHGFFIYNSTLHVPLIIKLPASAPGVAARVVNTPVSLVDVLPTVLAALRLPIPPTVQGRSLLGEIMGRDSGSASTLYSETYLPLLHFGWSPLRGLAWRDWQFIDAPRPELYDTRADPRERNNLKGARQALAHEMRNRLFDVLRRYTPAAGQAAAAQAPTDPALLDRLRSLGYVALSSGTWVPPSGQPLADPKDRIRVYELVSDAMADGQHGRYRDSLRRLAEAARTEPASLPIRYLAALDYYRLQDYPSAIRAFQAALALDPKFALATYYLGLAQVRTGDLDGAAASFERALELDPTNFVAAYDLGAADLKRHRLEEAVRLFRRATQINPNYAPAWEALGATELYQHRVDDAVEALKHAVRLAPHSARAHYDLGRAYQAQGRADLARQEFARAQAP